jgi:hypothetical protein
MTINNPIKELTDLIEEKRFIQLRYLDSRLTITPTSFRNKFKVEDSIEISPENRTYYYIENTLNGIDLVIDGKTLEMYLVTEKGSPEQGKYSQGKRLELTRPAKPYILKLIDQKFSEPLASAIIDVVKEKERAIEKSPKKPNPNLNFSNIIQAYSPILDLARPQYERGG